MRATIFVLGETCLIWSRKLLSNSSVLTTDTALVFSSSKIWGSLWPTNSPSLLGGPGGNGVAGGVGVAVGGRGVAVAFGVAVASGVGVLLGVGVSVGSAVGINSPNGSYEFDCEI